MKLPVLAIAASLFMAVAPTVAQSQTVQPSVTAPAKKAAQPAKTSVKKPALIDINRATQQELDALPEIGEARSEAIIKGRPYTRKDDLVRKGVIPEGVYKSIQDKIIAHKI
jgi:DNA uptake protein ComE-like DNA-binding protein